MSIFHNVAHPCPGRRLKGIVSVPERGKFLCRHFYSEAGFHEDVVEEGSNPVRVPIRHYICLKCNRVVFVYGPIDAQNIQDTITRKRKKP